MGMPTKYLIYTHFMLQDLVDLRDLKATKVKVKEREVKVIHGIVLKSSRSIPVLRSQGRERKAEYPGSQSDEGGGGAGGGASLEAGTRRWGGCEPRHLAMIGRWTWRRTCWWSNWTTHPARSMMIRWKSSTRMGRLMEQCMVWCCVCHVYWYWYFSCLYGAVEITVFPSLGLRSYPKVISSNPTA